MTRIVKAATPKFKHGWLSEDQDSDEEIIYIHSIPDDCSISTTSTPTISSTTSDDTVQPLLQQSPRTTPMDSSSSDLDWDSSPEQYQLLDPSNSKKKPPLDLAPARTRHNATSDSQVRRSNAFRHPRLPPPAPRKSRIPKPVTPGQVQMDMVNDVSAVLPEVHSRVFTNSNRPRRNSSRPDYRQLHLTGDRAMLQDQEEETRREERPRNHPT